MFGRKKHVKKPSRTKWLIYGFIVGLVVGILLGAPGTGPLGVLADPLSLVDALTGITLA